MNKFIKWLYLSIFCKPRFLNLVGHLGKKSFIREHRIIREGKYISIGNNTTIGSYSRIVCIDEMGGAKYTPCLKIGDNVSISMHFTAFCSGSLIVENNVLIAANVLITDLNHGIDPESKLDYGDQQYSVKDVKIGQGTWIGQNSVILPGVTIGKKCVIGASSVVTKNIPDYCIAVGNPAKEIKKYNFKTQRWEKI